MAGGTGIWPPAAAAGGGITALTGDVTASGSGSVAATIAARAVTYAKMQAMATARMLGRATAGSGDVEELTAAQVRTLAGLVIGTDVAAPRSDDWQFYSKVSGTAATVDISVDTTNYNWRCEYVIKDGGTGGVYQYGRANGATANLAMQQAKDSSSTQTDQWRSDWNDLQDTGVSNGARIQGIIEIIGLMTYGTVAVRWDATAWSSAHVTAGTRRNWCVFTNGAMTSIGWTDARSSSPQWEYILYRMKKA
jgi:hypothetical protein